MCFYSKQNNTMETPIKTKWSDHLHQQITKQKAITLDIYEEIVNEFIQKNKSHKESIEFRNKVSLKSENPNFLEILKCCASDFCIEILKHIVLERKINIENIFSFNSFKKWFNSMLNSSKNKSSCQSDCLIIDYFYNGKNVDGNKEKYTGFIFETIIDSQKESLIYHLFKKMTIHEKNKPKNLNCAFRYFLKFDFKTNTMLTLKSFQLFCKILNEPIHVMLKLDNLEEYHGKAENTFNNILKCCIHCLKNKETNVFDWLIENVYHYTFMNGQLDLKFENVENQYFINYIEHLILKTNWIKSIKLIQTNIEVNDSTICISKKHLENIKKMFQWLFDLLGKNNSIKTMDVEVDVKVFENTFNYFENLDSENCSIDEEDIISHFLNQSNKKLSEIKFSQQFLENNVSLISLGQLSSQNQTLNQKIKDNTYMKKNMKNMMKYNQIELIYRFSKSIDHSKMKSLLLLCRNEIFNHISNIEIFEILLKYDFQWNLINEDSHNYSYKRNHAVVVPRVRNGLEILGNTKEFKNNPKIYFELFKKYNNHILFKDAWEKDIKFGANMFILASLYGFHNWFKPSNKTTDHQLFIPEDVWHNVFEYIPDSLFWTKRVISKTNTELNDVCNNWLEMINDRKQDYMTTDHRKNNFEIFY